jgi:hypothetical protein
MAIQKLKQHKSPGIDQIPAELIKAGGRTIHYEVHKLINRWKKEELPEGVDHCIVVIIEAYCFHQLCTKCYPPSCSQG